MKLKRLKLLSVFRGLLPEYEIRFNRASTSNNQFEPICFVGLNGSGKSNALEALSEMFYYLENFNRSSKKDLDTFKTSFGFELDYYLPKLTLAGAGFDWKDLGKLTFDDLDQDQLITICKKVNELPIIHLNFNNKQIEIKDFYNNGLGEILPRHIIGYSSGQNELISNPFIKLDFEYYKDIKYKKSDATEAKLEMNRFQFLNYNVSKLISVANFIFDKDKLPFDQKKPTQDLTIIKKELEIKELNEFSINLSLKKINSFHKEKKNLNPKDENYHKKITQFLEDEKEELADLERGYAPSELMKSIKHFTKIDPFHKIKKKTRNIYHYIDFSFHFKMEELTIQAFRDKFYSADKLFQTLYSFQIMNIEKISRNIAKRVRTTEAGSRENLSDLIPKYEIDKRVFHLGKISFLKDRVGDPISYKHLSDGEHQLLQVLGSIILLDGTSTLFLLDEPSTHFNPEWKSKFIWLINEILKTNPTEDVRNQELVITTHSPFMISDSKKGNVIWMKAEKKDGPEDVTINTFGTSVNNLVKEFFNNQRQIADVSWEEMLIDAESNDINELNEALAKYGESHEKSMILKKLNKLIIEKGIEE